MKLNAKVTKIMALSVSICTLTAIAAHYIVPEKYGFGQPVEAAEEQNVKAENVTSEEKEENRAVELCALTFTKQFQFSGIGMRADSQNVTSLMSAKTGTENENTSDLQRESSEKEISKTQAAATVNEEADGKINNLLDPADTASIADSSAYALLFSLPDKSAFVFDKVFPHVNVALNIRAEATSDSELVGKLYPEGYATILERGEEWTKIQSGDVVGYAFNELLYFDEEAYDIAVDLDALKVVTNVKAKVYTKPSKESEILKSTKKGAEFTYLKEYSNGAFVAVQYTDDTIGYIVRTSVDEKFEAETAMTKAEIEAEAAAIAAKKAEEAAKKAVEAKGALAKAKQSTIGTTTRAAVNLTDDELMLLATVVAMEAVGESYEGQLAVANVVINRMLDGYWGDTISDVVYAPGQFSGANSGRVEKFRSRVTESCKKAAVQAAAGVNNIGNYMYFCMKNIAKTSSYKKYYILGCHCFYSR
ncbi:MAG: cell wall hydrolase [Lachnospiraceae bacterium]|nr:cell wall hydrolase [Lachnospiraceae bacterium]